MNPMLQGAIAQLSAVPAYGQAEKPLQGDTSERKAGEGVGLAEHFA